MAPHSRGTGTLLAVFLSLSARVAAARNTEYVSGTEGQQLAVDRYPALYSREFGDCLEVGSSVFDVSRFDAALYTDNDTVLFHLHGTSNIALNENILLLLTLDAYGATRYNQTIDPCTSGANRIPSLCPLVATGATGRPVPFRAWAAFGVSPPQIDRFPRTAFTMPDLEGFARLQVFLNSTRREVGCFQARLTNGMTVSHPDVVGPLLGVFASLAVAASFLAAAYGVSVPHMRMHYAHSLPVLLVFETYQAVFFAGSLAVDWPGVLVAWWSNFAWAAGMIYVPGLVGSVDSFADASGNFSRAGAEGRSSAAQAYGGARSLLARRVVAAVAEIAKRQPFNESNPFDYTWAGDPIGPGIPLPGTRIGFPATLAAAQIPAANAFTIGLVWFSMVLGATALFVPALKLFLEGLVNLQLMKNDTLEFFRSHYLGYTAHAVLRALLTALCMLSTLAIFQFSLAGAPAGPVALAAAVFSCLVIGLCGAAGYAVRARLRAGKLVVERDAVLFRRARLFGGVVPGVIPTRSSTLAKQLRLEEPSAQPTPILTVPFFRLRHTDREPEMPPVHKDLPYIKTHGWLAARYRRTRWWFFACYVVYQLGRAAFLGGGSGNPPAQVYGLFGYEVVAFVAIVIMNPFEGARNTALAVWLLCIAKIVTTGLSIAFLPEMELDRISTTTVGIVIIAVQALLVAAVLVLVVLSVLSTWMSMSRNRADFRPRVLDYVRPYYFESMQAKADDGAAPSEMANGGAGAGAGQGQRHIPLPLMSKAEGKKPEKLSSESESSPTSSEGGTTNGGGDPKHNDRSSATAVTAAAAAKLGAKNASSTTTNPTRRGTFSVTSVRRNPKIEDEHPYYEDAEDTIADIEQRGGSVLGSSLTRPMRSSSIISSRLSSSSLQQSMQMQQQSAAAAQQQQQIQTQQQPNRPRRTSWSSRDFALWDASMTSLEQLQQLHPAPHLASSAAASRSSSALSRRISGGVASPIVGSPLAAVGAVRTSSSTIQAHTPVLKEEVLVEPPSPLLEEEDVVASPEPGAYVTPPTSPSPRPVSPLTPPPPDDDDEEAGKEKGAGLKARPDALGR